jgi:hypothetical protein
MQLKTFTAATQTRLFLSWGRSVLSVSWLLAVLLAWMSGTIGQQLSNIYFLT